MSLLAITNYDTISCEMCSEFDYESRGVNSQMISQ